MKCSAARCGNPHCSALHGMIISTRESEAVRRKVLELGISQISGGSRTSVGGYAVPETKEENSAQFDISDRRTLDEVVNWLLVSGTYPSFCTACYREGRTGDRFMSLVKRGQIANCCQPNALMTLKEYLERLRFTLSPETGRKVSASFMKRWNASESENQGNSSAKPA